MAFQDDVTAMLNEVNDLRAAIKAVATTMVGAAQDIQFTEIQVANLGIDDNLATVTIRLKAGQLTDAVAADLNAIQEALRP